VIGDRHHGAVAPLEPETCKCELPGFTFSDDSCSCWKCGKPERLDPDTRPETRGGTMTDEPVKRDQPMTREQLIDRIEELFPPLADVED